MTESYDSPGSRGRKWATTEETRRQVLDAAREVFVENGYAGATMSAIVAKSGVSVGSVYHHFGGKAELFLALWEEFEETYALAARAAVSDARRRGVTDRVEIFASGARAFLENARRFPELAATFRHGDGPKGFEARRREFGDQWIRGNATLLGFDDGPEGRFLVMTLTSIVSDGGRVVGGITDETTAASVIDRVLRTIRLVAGEARILRAPDDAS